MEKIIRKTKIIATLGPASSESSVLGELIEAGVDIFRLNLKYGTIDEHVDLIDRARDEASKQGRKIQILVDLPSYSYQEGIQLANRKKCENLAISYIKKSEEISALKNELTKMDLSINIVAKIETEEALIDFTSILELTDSLMVARGDLGRSIPMEKVPFVQKEIVLACNKSNTMVIVATEMLLSMTSSKMPTRAEVSDVANAVLDGVNAVMLSEETAIGKNPVEAVKIMNKTILEAESWQKLGHLNIFSVENKEFKFGL